MTAPADPSAAPAVALRHAEDAAALAACFPVVVELRPGLRSAAEWLERARDMAGDGYRVLAAWRGEEVLAVAGYRIQRNLIHGRFLYVDDLVTAASARGGGLGARLLAELARIGAEAGCARLVLDTAATNTAARRFYLREGLHGAVVGFVKPLAPAR